MSDTKEKFIDPLVGAVQEGINKKAVLEEKRISVLEKDLQVKERKLDSELARIALADKETAAAKTISYSRISDSDIASIKKENVEYMSAARNKMRFIHKRFDKAIPFFRKNLILIGGKTGEGKSTTVANIVNETIDQISPNTGKRCRVLVITNEEKSADVYNRVTCLRKGWHYVNHDEFTDEQVNTFNEYFEGLSKTGVLTVVDDSFGGVNGTTTTVEGICQIFDSLMANKEYYDVIIIDYYQNISSSRNNPYMKNWEVHEFMASKLDQYKNLYPAPIILMAQVKPPTEDGQPFKLRVEGSKSISNKATCTVELVAERELLCSHWTIHKSRFNQAVGETIDTGYDNGKYVEYNDAFKLKVQGIRARQEDKEFSQAINPIKIEKEEKNEVQKTASGD